MSTESPAFGSEHWESVRDALEDDFAESAGEWWEEYRDDLVAVPEQYVRSLLTIGDHADAYALAGLKIEHRDLWLALRAETTAQLSGALERRTKLLKAFRDAGETTVAILKKALNAALGIP